MPREKSLRVDSEQAMGPTYDQSNISLIILEKDELEYKVVKHHNPN